MLLYLAHLLIRSSVTSFIMSFCSLVSKEIYKDHWKSGWWQFRRGLLLSFINATLVSGIYCCSKCTFELFSSTSKFEHESIWPAFSDTVHSNSVAKRPERGRPNTLRVYCGKCGNWLGHEFLNQGPNNKSRFWIYSECLKFVPKEGYPEGNYYSTLIL